VDTHLAQVNVARALAPLDTAQMADFVANLVPINALADSTPGFVWRLQTEAGDATALRVLDGEWLVNLSVWESIEALRAFVYRSAHADVLRRRLEWFERPTEAYMALWWIEAGSIPSLADAEERLLMLRAAGPSPRAFTLKEPVDAPMVDR
jgi:Domain of unknown function (DUF3291)